MPSVTQTEHLSAQELVNSGVPVTATTPVATDLDQVVEKPFVPRVTQAASRERPYGSDGLTKRTVLQQHVDFFDRDQDGKLYPIDTYVGFHRIGFNAFLSILAAFIVHTGFSYSTQDSWVPDPFFSILTKNIHAAKHGSDSGVYDKKGRFRVDHFEEIFTEHDKGNKGALTLRELINFGISNRNVGDPFGWGAAAFEWGSLWWIAKDSQGFLSKERIRAQYDGSLFYQLARAQEYKRSHKAGKTS